MNNLPEKRRPEPLRLNALTTEQINALTESGSYFVNEMVEYQELMMMYSCAIREVRTKLEVLNADLSMRYKRNPIEFISYRIKKPVSLIQKMKNRGIPLTVDAIERFRINNIYEVPEDEKPRAPALRECYRGQYLRCGRNPCHLFLHRRYLCGSLHADQSG